MLSAIIATAMFMCDGVIDIDDDIDDYSDCISHDILVAEQEVAVTKTLGQRLKEKLASMIWIGKGLTVDIGAADHVMPLGWLAWMLVVASLGSLRGVHYVSANGTCIPNR